MPRYVVERTFPDGSRYPTNDAARRRASASSQNNADGASPGSLVVSTTGKTYCIYDGPTPESIRRAAEANGLPVEAVTEVQSSTRTSTPRRPPDGSAVDRRRLPKLSNKGQTR